MDNNNIDYSQWSAPLESKYKPQEYSFWSELLSLILFCLGWLISAAFIMVAAAAVIAGFVYLVCTFLYLFAGQPKV